MNNSLEKLAQATGIAQPELMSIWDQVKANHARLESCKRHDFGSMDAHKLGAKYTCRACGGTADAVAVSWYRRGLEHNKKA